MKKITTKNESPLENNKEILKQNILLAGFMGAGYLEGGLYFIPTQGVTNPKTIELGKGHVTEYHKSWDWIMPVVEKIESLGLKVEIFQDSCDISNKGAYKDDDCVVEPATEDTKLEAVYVACVRFVYWFNKNK